MVACANQIITRIVRGEFKAGSKLPPERSLAVELGVDRGTLRTALQRLVAMGLIRQQPKNGTVVLDVSEAGISILPSLLQESSTAERIAHLTDLLLVRRHLAASVLDRLAARVFTDEDLEPVERALMELNYVVGDGGPMDADVFAHADMEVLRQIVTLTGSPVLSFAMSPIFAVEALVPQLRMALAAQAAQSLTIYRGLLQWLGTPPKARVATAVFLAMLAASDAKTMQAIKRQSRALKE